VSDSLRHRITRAVALGVLLAGLAGAYWLHFESDVELDPDALQAWLDEVGPLAPLLFTAFVAVRPLLLLPSGVVFAIAGILFGTAEGIVWATAGGTLGALLAFTLARAIGREAIERRLSGAAERLDRHVGRRGATWLAGYTALPVTPLTPAYYAAGLTSMKPLAFTVGSAAGLVPRSALLGFFGESLLAGDPTRLWVAGGALGGAVALGLLARRWLARRGSRPAPLAEAPLKPRTPS
jgi:uncharacterized membrane protein YdjX (TVP38/TMEM64 family)